MSEEKQRSRTRVTARDNPTDQRRKSERPAVGRIDTPERWRILLAPVRAELVQAFRCLGPSTVREVACWIGRPADGLYHHLRKLEEGGFVRDVGHKRSTRHAERIFDVTADDFAIDFPALTSREQIEAIAETGAFYLDTLSKALQAAGQSGKLELKEDRRNFVINYDVTKLTPDQFRRARSILAELKESLDSTRPDQNGSLYAVGFIMTPMARPKRGN